MTRRAILLLAMTLAASGVGAAPRSISDCEKIEAPLAYNACLADFGPARGRHTGARAYGAASEGGQGLRRHGRSLLERGAGGRRHMEFYPGVRGNGG
jgi:hypothetical protein